MDENLTRSERRKILRDTERGKEAGNQQFGGIKPWGIILVVLAVLGFGGYRIYQDSKKPLPGQAVSDMGNNHVTDISDVAYNSNPPTSGAHFPVWAKPGVYSRFISDGYFIHSMEHGYIVLWYDCDKLTSSGYNFIPAALAHGDEPVGTPAATSSAKPLTKMTVQPHDNINWITPQTQPSEEVPLPDSFKSDSCKNLVGQLSEFTKVANRIIVVPRQKLDSLIALSAWGRIDKLDGVDKQRIETFIKAFHNRGPEKTME